MHNKEFFLRTIVTSLIFMIGLTSKAYSAEYIPSPLRIFRFTVTACSLGQINGFLPSKPKLFAGSLRANHNPTDVSGIELPFDFQSLNELGEIICIEIADQRQKNIFDNFQKNNPEASQRDLDEILEPKNPNLQHRQYLSNHAMSLFMEDLSKSLQELQFPSSINFPTTETGKDDPFNLLELENEYSKLYEVLTPHAFKEFLSIVAYETPSYANVEYEETKIRQKTLFHLVDSYRPVEIRMTREAFCKEILGNKLVIQKFKQLCKAEKDLYTKDRLVDEKALTSQMAKIDIQDELKISLYFNALQMVPLDTLNNPSFICCLFLVPLDVTVQAIKPLTSIFSGCSEEADFSLNFQGLLQQTVKILLNGINKKVF